LELQGFFSIFVCFPASGSEPAICLCVKTNQTAEDSKVIIRTEKALRIAASLIAIAFLFFIGIADVKAQSAGATFTGIDTTSQGNWQNKYGADGYSIPSASQTLPGYATFAPVSTLNWTWAATTADVRGLRTNSGRTATAWYTTSTFSLDVNLTDQNLHQIAVYALDWDGRNRSETIHIVDANSGAVLDARSVSGFQNGLYLVWSISGHVKVNVTVTGGDNAVVSGVFFGGPAPTSQASAVFVNSDNVSQGNWQSKYGSDGYSIAAGKQNLPSYANVALQNQLNWTWDSSTTDTRALQSGSAVSTAATWYNAPSFSLDVNLLDGKSHELALYAVDWDLRGRAQTIQIIDANSGTVLSVQTVSSFVDGSYLVWTITGHVRVNIAMSAGPNAVLSGIFFGGASNTTSGSPAVAGTPAPVATTPVPVVSTPAPAASTTAPIAPSLVLNASARALNFSNVNVSSTSSQTVTFTNAGNANVTVSNVSVSGAGFNASGSLVGTTLMPGQTATLTATFTPATSGNAAGSITVTSNATAGATVITLAGTGFAPVAHTVNLAWSSSTSSVIGYNVYVSMTSGSGYTKLTANPLPTTDYSDTGLQTAQTRYYVVTSVSSNNQESAYSQEVSAIVP
jgi:hypothetical protein